MDDSNVRASGRAAVIQLRSLGSTLLRGWWLAVGFGLLGGVLLLGISLMQTPKYEASSTLYVTSGIEPNAQSAYQGSLASQQKVTSYAQLVKSEAVLGRALRLSSLPISVDEARSSIFVSSSPDTVLLRIGAVSTSPETAVRLVSAVSDSLVSVVGEIERPEGGGDALAKVTVVSPSELADAPVSPRTFRNVVIGISIGLVLGVLGLLLKDRFDRRVSSPEEISLGLETTVLGELPQIWEGDIWGLLTSESGGFGSPVLESLRKIRTSISFANVDHSVRSIMVTSSGSGEGKSTTAIGLAGSFAESGQRVLLVDCDLRRPIIATRLELASAVGLSEVLRGVVSISDVVQSTPVENLSVLAAGELPPNAADLLASHAAEAFLATVANEFDLVIVDVPPLDPVADAGIVGRFVDAVVVVCRVGQTRVTRLESSLKYLLDSSIRVMGVVVNGGAKSVSAKYGYYPEVSDRDGRSRLAE